MPGSTTAPGRPKRSHGVLGRVAFRHVDSVGTQDMFTIAARWLAYALPCQRFAMHLAVHHA